MFCGKLEICVRGGRQNFRVNLMTLNININQIKGLCAAYREATLLAWDILCGKGCKQLVIIGAFLVYKGVGDGEKHVSVGFQWNLVAVDILNGDIVFPDGGRYIDNVTVWLGDLNRIRGRAGYIDVGIKV